MDGFNKVSIRTDLAIEAKEMLYKRKESHEIDGVNVTVEENKHKDVKVTWVEILNENGSDLMGKPIGNYVTIESEVMKENNVEANEEIIKILAKSLGTLHNLKDDGVVLVIGLGNWNITPDALGPKVVSNVLVTRHIVGTDNLPKEIEANVRYVSAVTPGVMGQTGIETGEIVKGIAEKIKPDLIIAIDSLAARQTNRVNSTIQMSDVGINPGAGVGNKRMGINKDTMGIPVIAIGVPTVVDAATLVNDTMDKILDLMIAECEVGTEFYNMLKDIETDEKHTLIKEVLNPYASNMFVTPKEVDAVIDRLSNIISNAINIALHPAITTKDMNRFFA